MKSLNLLRFFSRPSILAFAMLIAGLLVFSSNASANGKNFDVLSGVTAETMSPSAMDAIRGMGSIKVGYIGVNHPHIIVDRATGGPWDISIHLEVPGRGKLSRTPSE